MIGILFLQFIFPSHLMKIILKNIGKQYKEDWVFRNVNFEFLPDQTYVILGSNGSGKSTLINVISSHIIPTKGNIYYSLNLKEVKQDDVFRHIAICSPYIELIEEFTLVENVSFFCRFKKFLDNITLEEFIDITNLHGFEYKPIHQLSSGTKQRLKIALAILPDVSAIFLDEPCTNLDSEGIKWYNNLVNKYINNRLIIVCSNDKKYEFDFCNNELHLSNFK
ncbi:MAG: ATP-binding cassette domain-containing protein [Bacteroidetes bacterium]|nr:ATP-binding cassette domain-containing protein [Bacteroidota bacterium]